MPSSPTPSDRPDQPGDTEKLSDQTIHDLLTPVTVIGAQSHMLRRWVRRSGTPDGEAVLLRLAVIDTMVTQVVAELNKRRHARSSDSTRDGT